MSQRGGSLSPADRNRLVGLQNDPNEEKKSPESEALMQFMRQAVQAGIPPHQAADIVFRAIRDERFYIFTDAVWRGAFHTRMEDILHEPNPTPIDLTQQSSGSTVTAAEA